jgi:hypothetical protein
MRCYVQAARPVSAGRSACVRVCVRALACRPMRVLRAILGGLEGGVLARVCGYGDVCKVQLYSSRKNYRNRCNLFASIFWKKRAQTKPLALALLVLLSSPRSLLVDLITSPVSEREASPAYTAHKRARASRHAHARTLPARREPWPKLPQLLLLRLSLLVVTRMMR